MANKTKKEVTKKFNVKGFLAVVILFLGTFGLFLSFAQLAYSVQNRTDTVASRTDAKWDIAINNVSKAELKGEAKNVNDPTSNNLGLTGFEATVRKPGDSVKYTFDINNAGSIEAKIAEFTKGKPTCKAASDGLDSRTDEVKEADSTLVCGSLEYSVTYEDGKEVAANDVIAAGSKKTVVMTVTYKEGSQEATGNVTVIVPSLTVLFK